MDKKKADSNLDEFIAKIRREAVDAARLDAARIIEEARTEASFIVGQAREEAREILARAQGQGRKHEDAVQAAIAHAARDAVIGLKNELAGLIDRLLREEYRGLMRGQSLGSLIVQVLTRWGVEDHGRVAVLCSEEDKGALVATAMQRLQDALGNGVEIAVHPEVKSGFRVYEKDHSLYYDFTDEGVCEVLREYILPEFYHIFDTLSLSGKEGVRHGLQERT